MSTSKNSTNPADMDQTQRAALKQAEAEALLAWQERGGNGRRPATPVTDYLAIHPEQARTRKVGTAKGVLPPEPATHAYWIGAQGSDSADRLVAVTQHSLSYMAGYTKTTTEPRVPTSQLITMLRSQGIEDIDHSEWTLILPQTGRVVRHIPIPGRKLPDGTVIAESGTPNQGVVPSVKAPRQRKPRATKKAAA